MSKLLVLCKNVVVYAVFKKEPLAYRKRLFFSGAKESRTPDLLHAMQALYQLSYNPERTRQI